MSHHNYLIEALEIVLGWELPDNLLPFAVSDQARLIAGFNAEEVWERYPD